MAEDYGRSFPDDDRLVTEVYGEGTLDDFLYIDPPGAEVYSNPSSESQ